MSINNFIPEVWSAQLLESLKKTLVYASPSVVNRNYEGEISQSGDTVKITSISRPTVAAYVPGTTAITPEDLTDAQRSLVVDQSYYFAFKVDDVDLRQAKNGGALMTEAADEAAYALADTADQYVVGLCTGIDTDNEVGTVSVTTAALALSTLATLMVRLDNKNVPRTGRFVVIPPWYHGLLVQNTAFIPVTGGGNALLNGLVGRAMGFDIMMSNNAPLVTGDDYLVVAGYPGAITYAEQINQTIAYRPESSFSDAIKGLHLYGAKIVRPEALASVVASIT